jgi:hypothetical protein
MFGDGLDPAGEFADDCGCGRTARPRSGGGRSAGEVKAVGDGGGLATVGHP